MLKYIFFFPFLGSERMASLFCNNDDDDGNVLLQIVSETNKRKFQNSNNNCNIKIQLMPEAQQQQPPFYVEPSPLLQFGPFSLIEKMKKLSFAEGGLPPQSDILFLQQQQHGGGQEPLIFLPPFILHVPPIVLPSLSHSLLQPPPFLIQPPPMPLSFFSSVF